MGPRLYRRVLLTTLTLLAIAAVIYTISRIIAFAQLFGLTKPHSGIRITQAEIAAAHKINPDPREPLVPKIIHQIFHNWHDANDDTLRPDWAAARKTCVNLHPDWEHMVSAPKNLIRYLFHGVKIEWLYSSCGQPKRLASSLRKNSPGSSPSTIDTHIPCRR